MRLSSHADARVKLPSEDLPLNSSAVGEPGERNLNARASGQGTGSCALGGVSWRRNFDLRGEFFAVGAVRNRASISTRQVLARTAWRAAGVRIRTVP